MRSNLYILLTIAGILFALFIVAFGMRVIPMADRGPGYIASNLVFTVDSVAAAPENTEVEYTMPEDYWKARFSPLKHGEYVVKLVIFEEEDNTIVVSKYTFCEYAGLIIGGKIEYVLDYIHEGVSKIPVVGGTLDAIGDAAGGASDFLSITKSDDDEKEVKVQVQKYSYYRIDDSVEYVFWGKGECGYKFNYGFSVTDMSVIMLGGKALCEVETFLAQEINEADFIGKVYYNLPEKFMFSKDHLNNKLWVEAECGS